MKTLRTLLFTISLCLLAGCFLSAQEQTSPKKKDSLSYKERYGLRIGIDISKPIRSFLDDNYTGLSIAGDYRISKNFFIAAEIGNENYAYTEPFLDAETNGSYTKIGANYNTYDNWLGMQNELYVGLRYGFASFKQTLNRYAIYTTDSYFEEDIRNEKQEFEGLNGSWVEFQVGIKTEVLNNLFLGIHAEVKNYVGGKEPDNFGNLYIPGFQKKSDTSSFGAGWGYTISYMIPIRKKERKQEVSGK